MAYISALITETLETMTKLVFINQPPSIQNLKTVNLLQERMIKLYVLVLHYLGLTNLYYKKGAWGRATMSLAGPENSEIIRVLNSVRNEEREVRQHYRMVCEERQSYAQLRRNRILMKFQVASKRLTIRLWLLLVCLSMLPHSDLINTSRNTIIIGCRYAR
jgi:hypothetical protein